MRRARGVFLAGVAALALCGCATVAERHAAIEPELAPIAIAAAAGPGMAARPAPAPAASPRSCVPARLAPPPRYPDSDQAPRDAPGAADRYQLMAAGRLMRERRLEELERIIAGCRP